MEQHPRRQSSSYSPPWEPGLSPACFFAPIPQLYTLPSHSICECCTPQPLALVEETTATLKWILGDWFWEQDVDAIRLHEMCKEYELKPHVETYGGVALFSGILRMPFLDFAEINANSVSETEFCARRWTKNNVNVLVRCCGPQAVIRFYDSSNPQRKETIHLFLSITS
jgi:hypothetical protein